MRLPGGFAAAAGALLVLDAAVRLAAGAPYPGATVLLLAACGLSLVPFLPRELGTPSLRVAIVPALGVGSFALLLTTVSIVGIELNQLSIRLAVGALVLAAALAGTLVQREPPASWEPRRELVAIAALAAIFGLAFASSFDIVEPFPPPGTDWAHNLQYADEVEAQGALLLEDRLSGDPTRVFSNPSGIGAVYGSFRIVDGVSSRSLGRGIAVFSAIAVLGIYAAVGGLWGVTAGLLAAAAYAVAPIRLEPMYWHGLGTTLALVFVPLILLALGLLCRGRGRPDPRTSALLGISLASVAVVHPASAIVIAPLVALILVADGVVGLARPRREQRTGALRAWWRDGLARPVLAATAVAAIVGAGAIVHLSRQVSNLGPLVSHRFFEGHWLDLETVDYYYSWPLLALVAASVALVAWDRERRRDRALLAFAALVVAAILVSQLWRIGIAFEYRRVVYYAGAALVAAIGIASVGLRHRRVWIAVCAVALLVVARESIGLRLPERLVRGGESRSALVDALAAFGAQLDREEPSRDTVLVADRCLGVQVPYILRRRTLVSAEEWQAGYESLAATARDATAIVAGGPEGRRLAEERGVDYVLVDPECHADAAKTLGGEVAYASDELVAVDVR